MLMAALCAAGWATKTSPESYGTFNHLCASVAHESASSMPRVWCLNGALAAAHSPNAPSTCSHPPHRLTIGAISWSGSNAPVLTFPDCAQTITGPITSSSAAASASGRSRPCSSAAIRTGCAAPNPSNRNAASTDTWTSSPTKRCTRGDPFKPWASTSHPVRRSSSWRAAASAVALAIPQPVTKPTLTDGGRPSNSTSHPAATSSTTAAAGDITLSPAF